MMGSMVVMKILGSEQKWHAVGVLLSYRWKMVVAPRF
jgi:hypothetical protein